MSGFVRRHIRRTIWAFALTLTVVLLTAPSVLAGHFHLYSCTDPATHAPLPTDGWMVTPGSYPSNEDSCASSGGLKLSPRPVCSTCASSYTFSTPAGLTITAATIYRESYMNSLAYGWFASPENASSGPDMFDFCQGVGETPCARGNLAAYSECRNLTLCKTRPYAPYDVLSVPFADLPSSHLYFNAVCTVKGCNGYEYMRSADIELTQTTQPTAVATAGSLTTATTLQGIADVSITADDLTSGVFQAVLQSNGRTVARQTIDANGGRCVPYGEAADGAEIFLYEQPCPFSVSNIDVSFDTALLPDGPQQVSILVADAAGNAVPILSRSVTVENSGAYLIRVHAEQERALAARGACNAQCDEHATILTANARLARKPFARRFAHSGLSLNGQLVNHAGAPMPNATVELSELPAYEHSKLVVLAHTTTNAKGRWTFRVPRGPSRSLTVGYRARANDSTYAARVSFRELVAAGVVLHAPPHTVAGRRVNFEGKLLGGFVPRRGVYVSLEIYYAGTWREIALLHADRHGIFGYGYKFAAIGPATYSFRARVPPLPDYPFQGGASPAVGIHLLP
ncbi:MAG TPA: carboxypeptidase-like regulatory domain-containing protein [Solirubrobacteraceae bacterium]|nr:carboxypeptidase-like regulatory domain-containing protein [Solirubrobacteraceae bacterium]